MSSSNNNHRINNNSTQACAACKYQRRKCAPDCILAPYFPHDRQRQFLNAHKLFGVSNITKIIRNLSPPEKDIAMRTIIYQSDVRAKDPIGGCYRIIQYLQHQIDTHRAELDLVLQQLAICRTTHAVVYQQGADPHLNTINDHNLDLDHSIDVNVQVHGTDVAAAHVEADPATSSSYDILQSYGDQHYDREIIPSHHENREEYVVVEGQEQHEDPHHHQLQHLQFSWAIQDSLWVPSDDGCREPPPFDNSYHQCGELKTQVDGVSSCVTDGISFDHETAGILCTDENGGFKFDPQETIEKSDDQIILQTQKVVREAEQEPYGSQEDQNDLRNAATLFTLTS